MLKLQDVADLLGVAPATLRRWDKKNILRAVRIGDRRGVGDRRYRSEDIKAFISKGLSRKR
ncbi:helix-turn-helix domain-containing protein [Patescibacteria group bacterium]|nr:helix-turn-helix domain-containing protein [Patescibacteria group bacterium]